MKNESQTQAKHTPGKWHVENDLSPDGSSLNIVTPDRSILIATTDGGEYGIPGVREAEANAALIASAPDLLRQVMELREALELTLATLNRVYTQTGKFSSIQGTLDVAQAALANATESGVNRE